MLGLKIIEGKIYRIEVNLLILEHFAKFTIKDQLRDHFSKVIVSKTKPFYKYFLHSNPMHKIIYIGTEQKLLD